MLTTEQQQTLIDFRENLTDRLIADHCGTTTVAHRARLATARHRARKVVGEGSEYFEAVTAAHRAASWHTGGGSL
jgi:hypothetical protein